MKDLKGFYYPTKYDLDTQTPACYVRGEKLLFLIVIVEV